MTQAENQPIRILIADDHGVVREGLRAVLEEDDLQVVGEATTGREAVAMVEQLQPDVVLLDIRMPDLNGLQALAQIKAKAPATYVIMLTTYATPDYLTKAIQAGAEGYLSKDTDPQQIPAVVRAVVRDARLLDRDLLREALSSVDSPTSVVQSRPISPTTPLTGRETEVLKLIVAGYSNEAIAKALVISIATVKTHVRHILEKLHTPDRTQAAVWAVRNNIA
jgi:DNA-binding NarL/FixJ family response regulator